MLKSLIKKTLDTIGLDVRKKGSEGQSLDRLEIAITQLQDAFIQVGGFPLPPPDLQAHVSGTYEPLFVRHGQEALDNYEKILAPASRTLSSFQRVLDFGCSVGRILRAFHYRRVAGQEFYGTDIDVPAIEWCAKNYPFAKFSTNQAEPPLAYPDNFFDFVYANSVMSHLKEDSQFRWLAELKRIVKPGGWLILTFQGSYCLNYWPLSSEERAKATREGFLFSENAYHTHDYVRKEWSRYFEIVELRERSVHNFQDSALCHVP